MAQSAEPATQSSGCSAPCPASPPRAAGRRLGVATHVTLTITPPPGWGAASSVSRVLESAGGPVEGARAIFVMNQEDGGFDCPGCAWPDDPDGTSTSARTA